MTLAEGPRHVGQLPFGTVTFLFTDIEGSTAMWELQREAMASALARHDTLMRECIARHGGMVIKTTGDGFHAVFASAPDAVDAALNAQRALHAESWPGPVQIRARMGLHTGEAELRDGDYYGPAVNRAARLAALANGGQTLVSEVTHSLCRDLVQPDIVFRPQGDHELKGLTRREVVFELSHPTLPQSFPPLRSLLAPFDETTPSIAVLPFVNLSQERDQEYFADGLAEELLNLLSKIHGLRVASRTSAFNFRGANVDLRTIGQKLNVATVLEGSVRRGGQRLRIHTQLVQVASDSPLWSETYDRELNDIFAVQDDIARAVVRELRAALLGRNGRDATGDDEQVQVEIENAAKGRGGNTSAYPLFLQGRFFADRYTQEGTAKAIQFLSDAVAIDSTQALAWASLARAYADQAVYAWAPSAEAFARARKAATMALELEPDLAEAHAAIGFVLMTHDRDWRGAHTALRRAVELAPGNVNVLRDAAIMAACLGRHDEAIALLRRAVTLDPLSARAHRVLGSRYAYAGMLEEAESSLRTALELNPTGAFTRYWLGIIELARGRHEAALDEFQREPSPVLRLLGLTLANHALRRTVESTSALRELVERHAAGGASQVARAYAYLGDADQAFLWLERADTEHDPGLIEIKADALCNHLHRDPRWPALLGRLGLADAGVSITSGSNASPCASGTEVRQRRDF